MKIKAEWFKQLGAGLIEVIAYLEWFENVLLVPKKMEWF